MSKFDHTSGDYFHIDDAKIYYERTGIEGKPVILFLHGGFGTMEDFNAIVPEMARDYTIIGIDNRGQGKSTLGSAPLTYGQIQKDVEYILGKLDIGALNIIGFSDGGIVGYRLAAMTPLNIEKLITIGADWHLKNTEPVRDLFLSITAESWREKFPETFELYRELNPEPDFKTLTESLIKMWLDSGPSGYPNESVKEISCPTLIVRGDDDHLVSGNKLFELSGLIENAHLFNIPFAGHVAFDDQKEIFIRIVHEFLKQ